MTSFLYPISLTQGCQFTSFSSPEFLNLLI